MRNFFFGTGLFPEQNGRPFSPSFPENEEEPSSGSRDFMLKDPENDEKSGYIRKETREDDDVEDVSPADLEDLFQKRDQPQQQAPHNRSFFSGIFSSDPFFNSPQIRQPRQVCTILSQFLIYSTNCLWPRSALLPKLN